MDLVDRLQAKLRQVVEAKSPGDNGPALTIAELYQQLIPYRAVRAELGILELAEYEHALLRLLSGERDYLRLEQPQVQRELREELTSPNPILGVYRDYAGVGVELLPYRPAAAESEPIAPEPIAPVPMPPVIAAVPPSPAPAGPPPPPPNCRSCHAALPDHPELRFCPLCGTNQGEVACSECGLMLPPDWRFCVRCGTPHPERRVP